LLWEDVNGDGAFSPEEHLSPAGRAKVSPGNEVVSFVTPDMRLRANSGEIVPYRFFIRAQRGRFSWSPACLWEGRVRLDGKKQRLLLYDANMNGSSRDYGQDAFSLSAEEPGFVRPTLSSLIALAPDRFYRLLLSDDARQARIEPYTGPFGRLQLDLQKPSATATALKASADADSPLDLQALSLQDAHDSSVTLTMQSYGDGRLQVPVGTWHVLSACLNAVSSKPQAGAATAEKWSMQGKGGQPLTVRPGETASLAWGRPRLALRAIADADRNNPFARPAASFAKGGAIYLSAEIIGRGGEAYSFFFRLDTGDNIATQYRILDPGGKPVASGAFEYG
jgi:hypothetical protein